MDIIIPEFAALVVMADQGGLGYLHDIGDRVVIHEHVVQAAKELARLGRSPQSLADWIEQKMSIATGALILVERTRPQRNGRRPAEAPAPVGEGDPQERQQEEEVVLWFRARMRDLREEALVIYAGPDICKMIDTESLHVDPGEAASWSFDKMGAYLRLRGKQRSYLAQIADAYPVMCRQLSVATHTRSWA